MNELSLMTPPRSPSYCELWFRVLSAVVTLCNLGETMLFFFFEKGFLCLSLAVLKLTL